MTLELFLICLSPFAAIALCIWGWRALDRKHMRDACKEASALMRAVNISEPIKPRIVFIPLPEGYPPKWWACSDEWWYRQQGLISNREIRGSGSTPALAYADYCRKLDGIPSFRAHAFSDAVVSY